MKKHDIFKFEWVKRAKSEVLSGIIALLVLEEDIRVLLKM